jgi:hypothetical protein
MPWTEHILLLLLLLLLHLLLLLLLLLLVRVVLVLVLLVEVGVGVEVVTVQVVLYRRVALPCCWLQRQVLRSTTSTQRGVLFLPHRTRQ